MATTTNFGWETPDDTDLVKDGAAAMRTLGNSIDTSFVDLKGGTTNQVLAKNSNTDLDFKWVADATGISATIFDAKGDIIAATAADTADRLAVGTNGHVLTADSTASTGIKWAAIPASTPSFVGCSVFSSTGQNISNATSTEVLFASENFDTDGFHSTTTNTGRITIPTGKGGKYLVTGYITFDASSTGSRQAEIRKNGTLVGSAYYIVQNTGASKEVTTNPSVLLDLVANDYITMTAWQNSTTTLQIGAYASQNSSLSVIYLGA
jgi:hypothetical protein